jgi:UDP-glucose:(heptosyl)LPS alpha-1,3-glucosyltransferase
MIEHPRIAVVSPFLDKRHGTERIIVEQIIRLACDYGYDVHIYSQRVEDIPGVQVWSRARYLAFGQSQSTPGAIWWHRIPDIPVPGVLKYSWWLILGYVQRWRDTRGRGLQYDLVFSPGINGPDADIILVPVVFADVMEQARRDLQLLRKAVWVWPWLLNRRFLYQMIVALEQRVYSQHKVLLVAYSGKTAERLVRFYGQREELPVVYMGVDTEQFHPQQRTNLRTSVRRALGLPDDACVLLLIGNAWHNKGLSTLLEAVGILGHLHIWVCVVGNDLATPYHRIAEEYGLRQRVLFLPPRPDVEFYYAAADVYVAPSRGDAFALPPLEAMSCGLAVISSSRDGVSEIVTDGVDAFILKDPTNADELAGYIERLYTDAAFRQHMGEQAAKKARQYTWDHNAVKMHMIFQETMLRKRKRTERG